MMKKIGKILLVDDNEITCYLNRNLLESMEIARQVESVHNGIQALQFINGKFIGTANPDYDTDLLFLDLNMPVMDGVDFLEELSKLKNLDRNRLKIVILTSSDNRRDVEEINPYRDLVFSFLIKPLEESKLKEIVKSLR